MADDAGALLVRSGLVSASALDEARALSTDAGGTIGEALVHVGAIADEALTEFYCTRLLVPKVNPNSLARLSAKVIAVIPADMAVELRTIPVSLDADNNLTVAMSDPSDRHAVDEIGFFTGAYVVRAVATQLQIAWCLAHYYGHVTPLGQRLLHPTAAAEAAAVAAAAPPAPQRMPRVKGLTGKVDAARHHGLPPIAGAVAVQRPNSTVLDDPTPIVAPPPPPPPTGDGVPLAPRPRSVSGEIRVPKPRAQSIKPPTEPDDDSPVVIAMEVSGPTNSGPVITMEVDSGPVTMPADPPPPPSRPQRKQRVVREDPPELAARTGEVEMRVRNVERNDDEPSILIDQAALEPPPPPPELADTSGELGDDTATIHSVVPDEPSVPILLERKRTSEPPETEPQTAPMKLPPPVPPVIIVSESLEHGNTATFADELADANADEIVVLTPKAPKVATPATEKAARTEKRTQVGFVPHTAVTRARDPESATDDTAVGAENTGVPGEIDDGPTTSQPMFVGAAPDPTGVERLPAPPNPDHDTEDEAGDDKDTGQHLAIPSITGRATLQMSAAELDAAVPGRAPVVQAGRVDYDPLDEGWGPPGTTIPPPLLGAIPGSEPRDNAAIPMPDVDSAPLMIAQPPAAPESVRATTAQPGSGPIEASGQTLVRALEEATSRSIELIHRLESARDRDEVIALLVAHLATTHQRAGFFAVKSGELQLFTITPKPASLPFATLRLDRPSTLQDVVGTRLPYRGPMHDDASRMFLAAALGDAPPEILLVPITIKERVVGVLFGEHRLRHTFDDQLALAARAAGMSLEAILRQSRR